MPTKLKPQKKYVPVPGSHLSLNDAEKVGQGIELLLDKSRGGAPSVSEFAEAAKSPKNPAHPVVKKKYEELKGHAWRNAAGYCLRNVDYIIIDVKGEESPPQKAVFQLDLCIQSKKEVPEGERRELCTPDMIRDSPRLTAAVEEEFQDRLHSLLGTYSKVLGIEKTASILQSELTLLTEAEVCV